MQSLMQKKLLVSLFAFSAALLTFSSTALANLTSLEEALTNKKYRQAYKEGEQLLPIHAGEVKFDFLFGMAAARVGEYDQAIFAFERVLAHNPNLHPARLELAASHFALGNTNEAKYYLNQLESAHPQPSKEVMQGVQLYTAAIKAQEEGRLVAKSQGKPSFFVETRLGIDGNPTSQSNKEVLLFGWLPWQPEAEPSTTTHTLKAGASYFKQEASNWGWFAGGSANQTGMHKNHNLDYYGINAQAGGFLLGEDWRLSLPVQVGYQERDDKNKLNILALGADFTQRLNTKADYQVYGQLAGISFKPSKNLNSKLLNLGANYNYKYTSNLTFSAGPVLGVEIADKSSNKYNSNYHYGVNLEAKNYLTSTSFINFNLAYILTQYNKDDPLFDIKRNDDRFDLGIKFNHLITNSLVFDTQINYSNQASNNNLHDYDRMQINFGLRKDW